MGERVDKSGMPSVPDRRLTLDLGTGAAMNLVRMPAGEFLMGSPPTEDGREEDEGPRHQVTISRAFYMGAYPVTRGQFAGFVGDSGYQTQAEKEGLSWAWRGIEWGPVERASWRAPGFSQTDDEPVVCVSWNDAIAFCDWLGRRHGRSVRLPTEAEWEYACRAGTATPFNTGDTISPGQANYNGHIAYGNGAKGVFREKTTPVGSFKPNGWGLFDTHGNVWQWCLDWEGEYPDVALADPVGPEHGLWRVLRGGCWSNGPRVCRSASRGGGEPDARSCYFGFRVRLDCRG